MADYFSSYPTIDYKFPDGTTYKLRDLNIKYKLSDIVVSKTDSFYPYGWRDGDRPDTIAEKYYDSSDYYWLVLASNNIYDFNSDLPMNSEVFSKYLIEKYKEFATTENFSDILLYCGGTIHHYEDEDGDIIDYESFQTLGNTVSVTILEYEQELNESKRAIKLIESFRAPYVRTELEDKLNSINGDYV